MLVKRANARMTMRRAWIACVVTGLAVTFAATERVGSAQQAAAPVSARLHARVQSQRLVRVIVGMAPRPVPSPAPPDAQSPNARADAIVADARGGIVTGVHAMQTLPFFTAEVDAAGLAALAASPGVTSIDEDVARPAALAETGPLVGAPDAWAAGYGGAGWTVAILDSGVDAAHPFLSGKVAGEACFSTTDTSGWTSSTSTCPGGMPSASGSGAATPCQPVVAGCEHGTHVAGIAAGRGASFSGIARDASILSIQVFSRFGPAECGGTSACLLAWDSDVVEALDYVYASRQSLSIAAANLSLGSVLFETACDSASTAMKAAIDQLRAAGIPTIVSAGNAGSRTALAFPACISSAVSVGSTTKADQVSSTSNTSAFLSLLAPGESVRSSLPGGAYGVRTGTSMAAPHVAGAWAVIKQRKPSAGVDEILNAIRASGAPVVDSRQGSGRTFPRLRVRAAVDALTVSQPRMALESPAPGPAGPSFTVSGWAVDLGAASGTGIDTLHVWAYPDGGGAARFVGVITPGERRDDVAATLGAQFRDSGYRATMSGLPAGTHTLVVYAHSTVANGFNQSRTAAITIASSWPQMRVDTPAASSTFAGSTAFSINGWAIDRAAATGTGVDTIHIWAFPVNGGSARWVGQASYGLHRPDVGDVAGRRFDPSGFSLPPATLPAGTYDLVVYARSTVAGSFNQCAVVRVTVSP